MFLVFLLSTPVLSGAGEVVPAFSDAEEDASASSFNPDDSVARNEDKPKPESPVVNNGFGEDSPNSVAVVPANGSNTAVPSRTPANLSSQEAGSRTRAADADTRRGPSAEAADLAPAALGRAPSEQEEHASAAALDQRQAGAINKAKNIASGILKSLVGTPGEASPPGSTMSAGMLAPSLTAAGPSALPRGMPGQAQAPAQLTAGAPRPGPLVKTAEGQARIGDFKAAEQTASRRLAEEPNDQSAFKWRAFARRGLGRFEGSSDDALRALELMPADGETRGLLIRNWVDLGRSQEALAEADKAIRERGPDAHILAARADAKASMGDQAGGLVDLAKAAMLNKAFEEEFQRAQRALAPAPTAAPRTGVARMTTWLLALLILAAYVWSKSREAGTNAAMRASDRQTPQPSLLPRGYDFIGLIAEGGMGAVSKARDRALNRVVAIKRMRPELTQNPRELARFIKEARLVAELRHANIVEIYAIEEDAAGVFLVFEHLEGRTLHERIGDGKLDRQEALGVLKQTALAVEHAHAQRIVHRDLKPANIMLTAHGVKVMDFGIARSTLDPLSTQSRVEVAGTPVYMAPEQEYSGAVGPAADVYALAGCAYEMLSGRPPFTYGGMMKAERRYIPLSQAAKLPVAVDAVMDRALDPNPGGRWQGAREFYSALEAALA